jgi:hypothetical protein
MKKLKLFSLALMALFSVSLWATDVDVVMDQIRVVPTKAGLVKISVTGNITASSGKLSVASNKNGTFTIASTNSTEFKVKSILG